ncbi:hypothetical protein [Thermaerobacillus caldiproteolyticus]|uniref:YodL-like protein n=1 Tax=Thermaerobacillus caldiproteolyticus TaxID=247480 RepID=A0A7W0BY79_9BACL|nr:hypothetical protein [Anoxybacillus caldiproteolyticus]MBA2875406.1 hypothetical protein [Anoxybacillus caldiproteolyticus]QPA32698.1 hypothetical protein ISX45_07200 [Anoxybacillus caldiproteolyticus]
MVRLLMKKMLHTKQTYDVTLFQTPRFGQTKGYRQVYRLTMAALNHDEALSLVYRMFNVSDLLPKDYKARYVSTGDIVLIDEGIKGQVCYKLCPEGWKKVNRIHIR